MTRILRVKGAFLEMLRGKLEDSNFSISLGLWFFPLGLCVISWGLYGFYVWIQGLLSIIEITFE